MWGESPEAVFKSDMISPARFHGVYRKKEEQQAFGLLRFCLSFSYFFCCFAEKRKISGVILHIRYRRRGRRRNGGKRRKKQK